MLLERVNRDGVFRRCGVFGMMMLTRGIASSTTGSIDAADAGCSCL